MGNKGLRGRMESGAAMYRMAEYCFDELNLHRITAFIYLFNSPSWRLLERCGAIRELTLKEHVVRDGDLCDMYCYGLLREDFQAFRDGETQLDGFTLEAMIESLSADDAGGAPS
jgi:RimJ/RimL family protein N-acetyltransferase